MSFNDQDYGSRRRTRRDSYEASPVRGRRSDYSRTDERYRRPVHRYEDRPRYRDAEEISDRRILPRRVYDNRRNDEDYITSSHRRNEPARPCKVLGVFGLSTHIKEDDLHTIFSAYGHVVDIRMVYDNMSGRSRGFGFVYYDTLEEARRAKTSCEGGLDIDGKIARVDYSLTTAPHDPTPGVYLGKRHNAVDRRRDRPYDRPHRSSRYPEDNGESYGRVSSRYSGRTASPRGERDRSPVRSRFPQRTRRRTISSSRSPQTYNGTRNIPNRSPERPRKQEIGNGGGGTKPMNEVWSDAE
ncbi:hypothetical protein Aperf_G00000114291 [Anoplocephala perfoliata]